jgi:predicted membrane channel-forming protein YqfA (hemolysin III family)
MSDVQAAIWAVVILVGISITAFAVIGGIAFFRSGQGQAKSFGLLFERGNFLRLGTAVLIILASILLAAIDKLTSEGVASILSGVAGYVLGGIPHQSKSPEVLLKNNNYSS